MLSICFTDQKQPKLFTLGKICHAPHTMGIESWPWQILFLMHFLVLNTFSWN
jgi:hypothetical protein